MAERRLGGDRSRGQRIQRPQKKGPSDNSILLPPCCTFQRVTEGNGCRRPRLRLAYYPLTRRTINPCEVNRQSEKSARNDTDEFFLLLTPCNCSLPSIRVFVTKRFESTPRIKSK